MNATAEKKKNVRLDNKCLTLNIIYKAQITNNTNDELKKYLGAAETSFREGYSSHMQDFKDRRYI